MKKYGVAKNFRLTFTAFIFGCFLLLPALFSLLRLKNTPVLDTAGMSRLHSGQYVSFGFDEFFCLPISVNNEEDVMYVGRLGGLSKEETGTGMDYVIFYAKAPNDEWIRVGIHDPALLLKLDQYVQGHGEKVQLKAKVVYRKDEYYYLESLRKWQNFQYDKYIQDYYVLEINENNEFHFITLRLILGTLCLVLCIIMFAKGAGIYPIISRPLEETPEYIQLAKVPHYALKEELEQKKRRLKVLRERQAGLKFWALLGILILLAGIAAIIDYILLGSFQFLVILVGFTLTVAGLEMLWHVFINSGSSSALRLADRYSLETYATKISKEEILISVIDRRIAEEKKENREKK